MRNKLILVEGIPGSGKSTISGKIKDYLLSKGVDAVLYNEGDGHPVDMAWNALLTKEEYDEVLKSNKEYAESIKKNSIVEDNYVTVAYTKLGLSQNENELMKMFENHEVFDGRVSLEKFKEIHFSRWRKFAKKMSDEKDRVIIFECAFLQNHICELLAVHEKNLDYIIKYMNELIQTVIKLNPKLIYLSQDSIKETISRVAKERVSDNKEYPDWIDMVINYFENSNYGKHNHITGFDGIIKFLEHRKEIELSVIDKLSIDKVIINNKDYNWDKVWEDILNNI